MSHVTLVATTNRKNMMDLKFEDQAGYIHNVRTASAEDVNTCILRETIPA